MSNIEVASDAELDLDYLDTGTGATFLVLQCRFECLIKGVSWLILMVHVTFAADFRQTSVQKCT